MRRADALRWTAPAAAALLALAACGGSDDEIVILPTAASFSVTAPTADPVVFFQKNPADTSDADTMVMVDVMLSSAAAVTFSSFTLEVTFDPGVVQVGQIDASATPVGGCGSPAACAPICADNISPSSADPANTTGDLLIGVANPLCPPANVTGTVKLLTIAFIGSSVGPSPLTLVDDGGSAVQGDCEILDAAGSRLPIPCDSGGAMITVAR